MHETTFAGLTAPDPGDDLSVDNGGFVYRNPDVTAHFLGIGAVTHRHDAHAALGNAGAAPAVVINPVGGFIYPDITLNVGYTLVDADGGETVLSQIAVDTTATPFEPPPTPMVGSADYSAGSLMADTYYYAISLSDGVGGETLLGPVLSIDVDPGHAHAQIHLGNMRADFAINGAVAWRLYKARAGQQLGFFASGTTNTFIDTGAGCTDCGQPPPTINRTNRRNSFSVQVPYSSGALVASGAVAFRIYCSTDGSFAPDCLLGEYSASAGATTINYTSLTFLPGAPPDVPTAIRGAHMLDPYTEIVDFVGAVEAVAGTGGSWKPPVATLGDLPTGGNTDGDVRATEDDANLHVWLTDTWYQITSGVSTTQRSEVLNFTLAGAVPVSSGAVLIPGQFFQDMAANETAALVKAVAQITHGTSVTFTVKKNGVAVTGGTGLVTTPSQSLDNVSGAIASDDLLEIVVTAISGTPKNLTVALTFIVTTDYSPNTI